MPETQLFILYTKLQNLYINVKEIKRKKRKSREKLGKMREVEFLCHSDCLAMSAVNQKHYDSFVVALDCFSRVSHLPEQKPFAGQSGLK